MEIKTFIEKIGDLPTLPTVATRITTEMETESLNAKSLGAIISEDSALTAKLLKLSNSAFYGMTKKIGSIEKAVMILGFNTVRSLALSVSVHSFFQKGKETVIDVQGLWNHSLGCAVACKLLVEKNNRKLADDAFLFGIVHDIGKTIFINSDLANMEEVYKLVHNEGLSQSDAEKEIFGFNHQRLGTALLREWKFPDAIIAGVKMHHNIPLDTKKLDHDTAQLVRGVCISNQMAKVLSLGGSTDMKRQAIPNDMWSSLGVERADLSALGSKIKENYNKILATWNEFA